MLALVANVGLNPLQIPRPETDYAIAGLPFQELPTSAELLVDLVRRRTLQLTNQVADEDGRSRRHNDVDVRLRPAHLMDVGTGGVDEFLSDVAVRKRFQLGCQ